MGGIYNGEIYHGWQLQKNSFTVQHVLNDTLSKFFRHNIETTGAGRTDTGVHASFFCAHFDLNFEIEHENKSQIINKLNNFFDRSIVIYDILRVEDDAHARFNAISRTYKYYINIKKSPFDYLFSYYYTSPLDLELMNKAAEVLFEYTDFSCFSKSNTQVKTTNCKIMEANWEKIENKLIFTIKADRFLRNMVRAIVGTLIDVGNNKLTIQEFVNIIKSKKRENAGYSVPAHALFLTKIEYPESVFQSNY